MELYGSPCLRCPNEQVDRTTPLSTRANVAMTGAFGYEMDLTRLPQGGLSQIRDQVAFYKEHRLLLAQGRFFRLLDPFSGNFGAWEILSEDQAHALVFVTRILSEANGPFRRLILTGLDPNRHYEIRAPYKSHCAWGDELLHAGLILDDASAGQYTDRLCEDFRSGFYDIRSI